MEGLALNNSLQVLRINFCPIGQDFLADLGAGLRSNTSLQTLDLSFNQIADKLGPLLRLHLSEIARRSERATVAATQRALAAASAIEALRCQEECQEHIGRKKA